MSNSKTNKRNTDGNTKTTNTQTSRTCGAIDDCSNPQKAIVERIFTNFQAKKRCIYNFTAKNDVFTNFGPKTLHL